MNGPAKANNKTKPKIVETHQTMLFLVNPTIALTYTARLLLKSQKYADSHNCPAPPQQIYFGMLARFLLLILSLLSAQAALTVIPRESARQWKVAEFTVNGAPTASNPFDPDQINIRGTFTAPSGKVTTVDGFWYQDYRSALSGSTEILTAQGAPEWRIRFTPDESGPHQLTVTATTPAASLNATTNFEAAAGDATSAIFKAPLRIAANRRYFESAGEPVVMNGANVCWHGSRGTFDYLDWLPAMQRNGENFARLWMSPWAFGIEAEPTTRLNYRLNRAWQLDRVFRIAETNSIWLMLCLEYHGMFQTVPDQFGGNNNWPNNPYNTVHGGPCAAPNDFFTNLTAREIYRKRLRYIIARWGSSPNLHSWQFFNEIDNAYNNLNANNVAAWHASLGVWLKENDPYKRLVTTSLTGSSDRAEIWNLAAMEFANYHSYNLAQPAKALPPIVQSMMTRYNKPVFLSEYGIDSGGFRADRDPYFRGLRQGIWAGLLGNTPGTSMSWWWEEIHARNLYSIYAAAAQFLRKTALGKGAWTPIAFVTNGEPPATVGDPLPGATPFNATLNLSGQWGFRSSGALAVPNLDAAGRAPSVLGAFFHNTAHPELRNLCRISANFSSNARLVLHLNSVSDGAIMNVLVDGASVFTQSVPNTDASYAVNNEYNRDYAINIPAGKRLIEVRNTGADWYYLDWIRLEQVLPSTYANNWTESPVAIGVRNPAEALAYIVNPAANFPANATVATIPAMTGANIRLNNWPAGSYTAIWNEARNYQTLGKTTATTVNGILQLNLPAFREDIVARIIPANRVSQIQRGETDLLLSFSLPAAANTFVQSTTDFLNWTATSPTTFGAQNVTIPYRGADAESFRLSTTD